MNISESIIVTLSKTPGLRVRRNDFLITALNRIGKDRQEVIEAIESTPVNVLSDEETLNCIQSVQNTHRNIVTTSSFFAGIPGGLALMATVPADILQYYANIIVFSQKCAYLCGLPEVKNPDDFKYVIILALGIASGLSIAVKALRRMAASADKHVDTRLMVKHGKWLPDIIWKILESLSKDISKKQISRSVGKAVPVLGGLLSGGITLFAFSSQSDNVKKAFLGCRRILLDKEKEAHLEIKDTKE